MKNVRRFMVTTMVVVSLTATRNAHAMITPGNVKTIYVNTQNLITDSQIWQEVQKVLKNIQDSFKKKFDELRQSYIKEEQAYRNKSATMSKEAQEKEEEKLFKMQRELQEQAAEMERQAQDEVMKETTKVDKELMQAAQDLAKEMHVQVVTDITTGRALYVDPAVEYTKDLARIMDTRAKKKKELEKKAPATSTNKMVEETLLLLLGLVIQAQHTTISVTI